MHPWPRSRSVALCAALVFSLVALGGLGGRGAQAQDLDDILGGFEDEEDESFTVDESDLAIDEPEGFWELGGSFELTTSISNVDRTVDTLASTLDAIGT